MVNIVNLVPAHYNFPNRPEAEWWLPAPCQRPHRQPFKRRFSRLVNYMINRPLRTHNLPYEIEWLKIVTRDPRNHQQCVYEVAFDLHQPDGNYNDARMAFRDIDALRPICQKVELLLRTESLRDSSPDTSPNESPQVSVLYLPNCRHNLSLQGHVQIRRNNFPSVRQ